MKEGSDGGGGGGRGGKGNEGEAGGSVGYPFESWKLIQGADMLTDDQTAKQPNCPLCIVLSFSLITLRGHSAATGNTYCILPDDQWKTCTVSPMNTHTHSVFSPLSAMLTRHYFTSLVLLS